MKTVSLRLPADVVEALRTEAARRGLRWTALARQVIERSMANTPARSDEQDLAQRMEQVERRLSELEPQR